MGRQVRSNDGFHQEVQSNVGCRRWPSELVQVVQVQVGATAFHTLEVYLEQSEATKRNSVKTQRHFSNLSSKKTADMKLHREAE